MHTKKNDIIKNKPVIQIDTGPAGVSGAEFVNARSGRASTAQVAWPMGTGPPQWQR